MVKTQVEIRTEIASGTSVRGRVQGAEDLSVAGRVEGTIELEGTLFVEPSGIVKADVTAERVSVSGIVVGNISAVEAVEITAEGRVKGDISAPILRIEEGGRFSGALEIGDADQARRDLARLGGSPRVVRPADEEDQAEETRATAVTLAGFAGPKLVSDPRKKRIVVKKRT